MQLNEVKTEAVSRKSASNVDILSSQKSGNGWTVTASGPNNANFRTERLQVS